MLGFLQEMSGVGGGPPVVVVAARPVAQAAVVELHRLNLADGFLDVVVRVVALILGRSPGFLLQSGRQIAVVKLREGGRHGLLQAAVGVLQQVAQVLAELRERRAAHNQPTAKRGGQEIGFQVERERGPAGNHAAAGALFERGGGADWEFDDFLWPL